MSKRIILLSLLFVSADSALAAAPSGQLELYRWNEGRRVENEPSFSGKVSEAKYARLLSGENSLSAEIFSGCYLAYYQREIIGEKALPRRESRRVCLHPSTAHLTPEEN